MLGEGVLSGVRILDLTQNVAGPFCSQILGDLGAGVLKIERPGTGDDTRQWRPPEVGDVSATFLSLNRNKRSVAVDIDTPQGQKILRELVQDADVFIHSLKPGSVERRGLGDDDLAQINPRLVYCAISAFGQTGPLSGLPGYDPLLQAFTGIMSVTGSEGQDPVRVSVSLLDMGAGLWSALGIVAALLRRRENGRGGYVETSLMETGVNWMTILAASYLATGALPKRMGSAMAMIAPYELFRTSDGHVFIAAGNDRLFRAVCDGLGRPGLAEDARFATNATRVANRAALHEAIEQVTSKHCASAIVSLLRPLGAPCSEMHSVADMLAHEQVRAAGIVVPLPIAAAPDHQAIGLPLKIDGFRGVTPREPPKLGADTEATLGRLGYSQADIARLRGLGAVG